MMPMWKDLHNPNAFTRLEDMKVRSWAHQNPISAYQSVSPYMNPQDFAKTSMYRIIAAAHIALGQPPPEPGIMMPVWQPSPYQMGNYMRSRM